MKSLSKYVTVFTSAYKIKARKTGGQEAVRHGTTRILAFDVNVKYRYFDDFCFRPRSSVV